MGNNRLLVIAVALIALGLMGLFASTWFGGYRWSGGMPPMMGMMNGMMGGGMMDRDQMKDMMQRMMAGMLPPGIKPENLPDPDSRGARLLNRYCTQCHDLPAPAMHSADEWPPVVNRMFARMSMMSGMGGMGMMDIKNPSPEEQRQIIAYLKAHSMRPISPEALPSPGSKGALLFKETCSQCHALPDPKLHTAEEWPAVVERMQGNMQSMGRRVVTEEETKEIVDYLMSHAQR